MEQKILIKQFTPTASDIDLFGRLRLSALLQLMQNMATDHAEILNFGGTFMQERYGAFWLMARTSLSFSQPILHTDTLEVHTSHRGFTKGVTIFRDFDFYVRGKQIGEATTSWVIVDINSRKIVKPAQITELVDSPKPSVLKTTVPEKIQLPTDLAFSIHRECMYSDTDINGHMNNTKYADIALDALHFEQFAGQYISEMQINYLKECFPGDTLTLCTATAAQASADTHFVLGKHKNDEPCFAFSLKMQADTNM